jgi:hypothetical protein
MNAVLTEKIRTKVDSAMPIGLNSRDSSRVDIVACAIVIVDPFGYQKNQNIIYILSDSCCYISTVYAFTTL